MRKVNEAAELGYIGSGIRVRTGIQPIALEFRGKLWRYPRSHYRLPLWRKDQKPNVFPIFHVGRDVEAEINYEQI